jgi:hypothetical protein
VATRFSHEIYHPSQNGNVKDFVTIIVSIELPHWTFFSADLRSRAECSEAELLAAMSVDASLLPALNDLLLEVYAALRPKPIHYQQRNALVHDFSKMTTKIFGN